MERRTIFEGSQFDVVVEERDGKERELVDHPGSVGTLAAATRPSAGAGRIEE
jgi:hypothetical protein